MGIIYALISMFGWGTADFLAAKSSRKIGAILTLLGVQLLGFLIALIYFLFRFNTFDLTQLPKYLFLLIIIGFFQIIAYLAYYRGLKKGQVSLVTPVAASWAIITVILSVIFLKETLLINQIIAIFLILIGIIVISIDFNSLKATKKVNLFKGIREGIIAMLGWGVSMFLLAFTLEALGWFVPVIFFKIFGISLLFIYGLATKSFQKVSISPSLILLLLPIGILDISAFFTYNLGINALKSSIVAPVAASFPVITIILARIFLKERLKFGQILGIVNIVAGLLLISI